MRVELIINPKNWQSLLKFHFIMKFLLLFVPFLLIDVIIAEQTRIPEYICDTVRPLSTCLLKNVRLTTFQPHFYPKSNEPMKVKSFEIQSQAVPKLVSSVCQIFPNLEKYTIGLVDLEEVTTDAFSHCHKLREINIFANKLHHLDENLFKGITALKTVYISSNLLEEIPVNLFKGLSSIRRIQLPGQKFTSISPEVFKDLSHLQVLDLSRNNLKDLNVETLLKYTPELVYIWIRDNDFRCSRLRVMTEFLKNSGVTVEKRLVTSRERNYTPEFVDGVECLNDMQFSQLL